MPFQFGSGWEKVGLFPSPLSLTPELNTPTCSFFHPFLPLFVTMKMCFDAIVGKLIPSAVIPGYEVGLGFIY